MTNPEPDDTCRPVEVDGETIRMRGAGEFTDQEQQFAEEIVRAAKRKYTAEHGTLAAEEAERFKQDYLKACGTIAEMHAAATGRHGLGPIRGVIEDVQDVRERGERAVAAIARVRERCQPVRDREGPSGMINASQILGLLSPTWPDGNYEAPAAATYGSHLTEQEAAALRAHGKPGQRVTRAAVDEAVRQAADQPKGH